MKKEISIILSILLIVSFVEGNENATPVWYPYSEIAGVQCGDSRKKVIEKLGKPSSQSERFLDYTELGFSVVLTEGGKVYSFACGSGCDPERILATRFKYRTDKGIGMNSFEAEVLSAYGEPTKKRINGDLSYLTFKGERDSVQNLSHFCFQ